MIRLVSSQIEQREREYATRNDFLQCLIQIRNGGPAQQMDTFDGDADTDKTMSIEQCVAHVFLFYLGGFDTSASVAAYTVFEAARHPRVLALLLREIEETLQRHDGELTYECIGEMKYLELCLKGE